jgi:hypothetical protein
MGSSEGRKHPPSDRNLLEFMMRNPDFKWGDLPSSEGAVRELGVRGAIEERGRLSPRRPSSGMTSEIQRTQGRKGRQEHYKRKAILEKEKEEERRRVWLRRHPGASESDWLKREEKRKTRKVSYRNYRKRTVKRG